MSQLIEATRDEMLDALTIDEISLHTAYPGTPGSEADGLSNEVTGGTYARQSATTAAATGGARDINVSSAFDVPAGQDVACFGLWDSVGPTFKGYMWNGGGSPQAPSPFIGRDSDDVIEAPGHGLSDDDRVAFMPGTGALPSGLSEGTIYYVINATTDTFQVATSSGGAAVSLGADGAGLWQEVVIETYASDGTFTIDDGDLQI